MMTQEPAIVRWVLTLVLAFGMMLGYLAIAFGVLAFSRYVTAFFADSRRRRREDKKR